MQYQKIVKLKLQFHGNTNLNTGLNKITIKVTAQDNKTTKIYTVNVTKTDNPSLANANLENLAIENVVINPEFNENIYEYTAEVKSDVSNLNILAIPKVEGATVNIQKTDELQFGENVITITVMAKDGITTNDYIINVYRKTEEEEQNEIAQLNAQLQDAMQEEEEQENEQKIGIGNVVFSIFITIGILIIIFMIIMKYRNERKI